MAIKKGLNCIGVVSLIALRWVVCATVVFVAPNAWAQTPSPTPAAPPVVVPPTNPIPEKSGGVQATFSKCIRATHSYRTKIESYLSTTNQGERYSLVVFCGDLGGFTIGSDERTFGVVGDPIFYAYYGPEEGTLDLSLTPTRCLARRPGLIEYAGVKGDLSTKQKGKDGLAWNPEEPVKVTCFNTDASFQMKGFVNLKDVDKTFILTQYERYNFSAQIGVVFTDSVERNYTVTNSVVRDLGPINKGPEYFASIVVYGLPNYLSYIGGRPYHGRDIINENSWADRTGLLLGFGISEPKKLLLAGISYELVTGINLVAAHRWALISKLDGVAAGDNFSGAEVPKKEEWDGQWVFGVSIDGQYLAKMLPSK